LPFALPLPLPHRRPQPLGTCFCLVGWSSQGGWCWRAERPRGRGWMAGRTRRGHTRGWRYKQQVVTTTRKRRYYHGGREVENVDGGRCGGAHKNMTNEGTTYANGKGEGGGVRQTAAAGCVLRGRQHDASTCAATAPEPLGVYLWERRRWFWWWWCNLQWPLPLRQPP
jgi:hypothetical protein